MIETKSTVGITMKESTAGIAIKDLTKGLRTKLDQRRRYEEFLVKFGLLALLTVQNAIHVLAMRYIRVRPQEMFLSSAAVFFTELFKLLTCLTFVTFEQRSFIKCLQLIKKQIFGNPTDTLKVCIPALMYVLMSILMYTAVSNLAAATFMVTFQLKVLSAAIFTVFLLHRRLSLMQWLALPVLLAGIVLVQMDEKSGEEHAKLLSEHSDLSANSTDMASNPTIFPSPATIVYAHITNQKPLLGLAAVLAICLLSGFAGVFLEKILKENTEVSVWIRNVQLCIVSLPVSIASIIIQDGKRVSDQGLLVGFDMAVWLTIALGAFGGLIVAVIIKYTDNILKAFATSFAVVLSCLLSALIFHFQPTIIFLVGTGLVILAVCVYSAFPCTNKYRLTLLEPITTADDEKQKLQPSDV